MGIYDRDYYRDDSRGESWGASTTTWLIVTHVTLFVLLALGTDKTDSNEIIRIGGFRLDAVLRGEVWRLLTSHLIPSRDLITVVIGMFLLYWAGRPVEAIYGPKLFLAFYLTAALVAGIAKLILGVTGLVPDPSKIGLAAPLFAVMVLFACHFPRQIVLLFFVLPVQIGHLVAALVGLYLFSVALSFANGGRLLDAPSVLACVAFAGFFYLRGASWFASLAVARPSARASRSRSRSLRLYPGDSEPAPEEEAPLRDEPAPRPMKRVDEHLEAKLDEVLEKLARFGPEHLSREENEVLMKASEAYQRLRK